MKKLTRSKNDKIIFGVCGGLAEYFNIDAIIIRIIWFILSIPSFGTLTIVYLLCGIIIPEGDEYIYQDDQSTNVRNTSLYLGLGLIIVGAYMVLRIIYPQFIRLGRYWPGLLIILGLYIIFNNKKAK
ncbi:PspC domain-containing protein [Tissierella creatinini]|nr:PspC domain-containing protein [Tissierella creatinini]TJX66717.1 PspC domain-containing protein [Soehngenia saccharolytica]